MQHVYPLLLANSLAYEVGFPLPFFVVFVESPIALIPAHSPYVLRNGIIIEVRILALWQLRKHGFYLFLKLSFGDDVQLAMLGKMQTPVPCHAWLAAHVGAASVSID